MLPSQKNEYREKIRSLGQKRDDILNIIVSLDGHCLHHTLCSKCPFSARCIAKVVSSTRTSVFSFTERKNMALDALVNSILLGIDE